MKKILPTVSGYKYLHFPSAFLFPSVLLYSTILSSARFSSCPPNMSDPGDYLRFPTNPSSADGQHPADPTQPLLNLAAVNSRMDSLHCFISASLSQNVLLQPHQMQMVSAEISSAIQQVILNGASLLAFAQIPATPNPNFQIPVIPDFPGSHPPLQDSTMMMEEEESKVNDLEVNEEEEGESEVIELDAVEILAEHIHLCEICGKGFKRDANLRMHMRAHGERFKRPEALAKPVSNSAAGESSRKATTRFSCPFAGCNRNQQHNKFKPLKSVICARNHFKRSHCPKMYSCERCHKKNFSVLSDLKAHLNNCGAPKWRCSCGTTFSRKDKLFGHVALFEGHMPAAPLPPPAASGQGSLPEPEPEPSFDFGLDDELLDCFDERTIQEMFGRSSSPDFVQQFYM